MPTKIQWTNETWNPITGCTKISPGCKNCYAEKMAKRLKGRYGYPQEDPFRPTFHPEKLTQPFGWKKPRMIFVVSMGDLFHNEVLNGWLDEIFNTIEKCQQHTFQILTKRPQNLRSYLNFRIDYEGKEFKIPNNVWLGVTAENQEQAEKRIPILLQIPAAVHFISCEPLLGPIDLTQLPLFANNPLRWVIVGGESGPNARPMHPDWARSLRDQCQAAGVPFFFKQWGELLPGCQVNNVKQVGRNSVQFPSPHNHKKMNTYYKVGKNKSGRLLDRKEWNKMPAHTHRNQGDQTAKSKWEPGEPATRTPGRNI